MREIDLTAKEAKEKYAELIDRHKLQEIEQRVTEYIQRNFRFVAFKVDDKAKRLRWESRIISTVSLCEECCPSDNWLGLHSPKATRISHAFSTNVEGVPYSPISSGFTLSPLLISHHLFHFRSSLDDRWIKLAEPTQASLCLIWSGKT